MRRIEARLEQPDEAASDFGMAAQRVFQISLAERGSSLPQHFRVDAKHSDLAHRQAGGEDETVEPVILDPARPCRDERLFESLPDHGGHRGQEGDAGELNS